MNFFFKAIEPTDLQRLAGVIATGEELVRIQTALFSELSKKGLATAEARNSLRRMEDILHALRERKNVLELHFALGASRASLRSAPGARHREREQNRRR